MTSCNEVNRKTSFVNTAMAYTYYDVGKYIIEGEQQGETRAAYGKAVLKNLSVRLSGKYGKGWSVATLKNTKKFYSVYSEMTNSVCPIESKKAKNCLANSKHEAGSLNTQNTENICLPTKRTGLPRTSPIMLLPRHEIAEVRHLPPPHI